MEFSISLCSFLENLNMVSRAIKPHSPSPALHGVLIELSADSLTLTGSSSDFIIRTRIIPDSDNRLQIIQPGSLVVDARILSELLRRLQGDTVQILTLDESLMRVKGLDGNFDLVGIPASQYPEFSLERPEMMITVDTSLLEQISSQISYAASDKDNRLVLKGINLTLKDGNLTAAATDSYRLAYKSVPFASKESFSITIPADMFVDTVRSFGTYKTVDMFISRKKVQFLFGETLIQVQLYEGSYPDASRIIPNSFVSTLLISSADLEGMLLRSSIYTANPSTTGSISPVKMDLSADSIGLQVLTSSIGSCRQQLENGVYSGQDLTVSFNAQLMLDALRAMKASGNVELGFTGELRPIRVTNPDDPSLVMIVVPLRSR